MMKQYLFFSCFLVLLFARTVAQTTTTDPGLKRKVYDSIVIDCRQSAGNLRPLHGVNGGVLVRREFIYLRNYWDEMGVPVTRLHDQPWCADEVVDIHTIFPDMSKDPADPASYKFRMTDDFIQPIITGRLEVGADLKPGEQPRTEIVYRLGESIEHSRGKAYIHPPADVNKWAEVCLGIVRHYNEGWAKGFHNKIRYWEIWNEAENQNPASQWTGNDADYYKLYTTTALKLKAAFPDLKIGGPACGVQGEFTDEKFTPSKYIAGFMEECKKQKAPLDFFSWHWYSPDPAVFKKRAVLLRKWLDGLGYTSTELHLNEWNFNPPMRMNVEEWYNRMGGVEGAAFSAYVLLSLQDAPINIANFYSGDVNPYGMFSGQAGGPKKVFYAFKAFRFLLNTPIVVSSADIVPGKTMVTVAKNQSNTEMNIMLVNFNNPGAEIKLNLKNMPWKGDTRVLTYVIDSENNFELTGKTKMSRNNTILPVSPDTYSVTVFKLQPM